ncbi:3-oxoacyl-[acyl-carrier-protein] synthase 3 [Enhygromyxa salina]|uniref:3-oxoacyl-[acyl-carrier-protein] synthase 3 n=1 Tax=Enhygromyxa salina TaxID=215803 RepID=A0A2S9XGD0_9BACT|nr:3-oxoacyl-ACP synthase III family protein [Enhygromyxa salina]PRP91810.1 3-oxoacyl-[acyl-carrier-protein] synthase 3 [Enhygromyxa salina]
MLRHDKDNMANPTSVGILGMGVFLPETIRLNDHWDAYVEEHQRRAAESILRSIETPTAVGEMDPEVAAGLAAYREDPFRGAVRRRVIDPEMGAAEMGARAAKQALDDAGLSPRDVGLLMVFSDPPDNPIPEDHGRIAELLELPVNTMSLTASAACASYVHQLTVATHLHGRAYEGVALAIQTSAASRVSNPARSGSVVVGDASVASVIGPVSADLGFIDATFRTRGNYYRTVQIRPSEDQGALWYKGGAHKSDLAYTGPDAAGLAEVGARAVSLVTEVCEQLLAKAGCTIEDVAFLASPQTFPWLPGACARALGLPEDRTLETFSDYGHCMAAGAPLNLYTAARAGRLSRGDLVLTYAQGAGFMQGASLLRWGR